MEIETVDRAEHPTFWRAILVIVGVLALAAGIVLEVVILEYHSTTNVVKHATYTSTINGPSAPPSALVMACLGAGVLLLVTAAFFDRINKIVLAGIGEIGLDAEAEIAGLCAVKAGGDQAKAQRIFKRAASEAADLLTPEPMITRVSSFAQLGRTTAPQLDHKRLEEIVDGAARQEG